MLTLMHSPFLPYVLMACAISGVPSIGAAEPGVKHAGVSLGANQLSVATGQPSLVVMSGPSTHVPVWSLSGGTVGQSVAGVVSGLPADCRAVRVEIVVTTNEATTSQQFEDVYRVHLAPMVEQEPFTARHYQGTPVRATLPAGPLHTRTIVLESFHKVPPNVPLVVRVQREPGDPADTFIRPTGLVLVKVIPVESPPEARVVQDQGGYNSWPMIQAIGSKLVCAYSRGKAHTIHDDPRAVYARTSTDGGKTWTDETVVANTPGFGEVTVGKGLDASGAMLLWVRRVGSQWIHDLYRTEDGVKYTLLSTPKLEVSPVQITDIFEVPGVGLMCLWFAGNYKDDMSHSWGTLTSSDNGVTWTQTPVESNLSLADWPTEPAAVHLGDGKILAIARTEQGGVTTARAQYQMISTDAGKTWKRTQTNIGDVAASTPSLIFDKETGLVSNYYYQRGQGGVLRRRVVEAARVFENSLQWPMSEAVALGSEVKYDAGNVNATFIKGMHYLSFYSGEAPATAVLVSEVPAPTPAKAP